ncbi:MAG: cutinase family protein [Microbacteriaceae bacterium]|nr:cutinase family protein [Microbacteriaceae bacterium]
MRGATLFCSALFLLTACAPNHIDAELRDLREAAAKKEYRGDKPKTSWDLGVYTAETKPLLPCTDLLVVTVRGTGETHDDGNLGRQTAIKLKREIEINNRNVALRKRLQKLRQERENEANSGQNLESQNLLSNRELTLTEVDLDYPASGDFGQSVPEGMRKLRDRLNQQAASCRGQKTVIIGYSQGALVAGEVFTPPNQRLFGARTGELNENAVAQLQALVMFGNPRFVANEKYNRGNFDPHKSGILARRPGVLDPIAEHIVDFCARYDVVCQSGSDSSHDGHFSYYGNGMQKQAVSFVLERLNVQLPPKRNRSEDVPI